jgi:pyruvate dehydrogenase E2 component (dihydrolipoamide acetyltransferase)
MIEFRLPSLGSDMDEGKLLLWNVAPGDAVKKGDVLAVVDTSKAAVDIEAWVDGTVHRLAVEPGATIPVGTVMALLLAPGEAAPVPGTEAAVPLRSTPPTRLATPPATAASAAPEVELPIAAAPAGIATPPVPDRLATAPQRRRVSPAARRRAAELGVDLAGLGASGADGAVTLADVERAARRPVRPAGSAAADAAASAAPAATVPSPTSPVQRAADRAAEMRQAIGAAMSRSKREIPHYYLAETVPMRRALDWLRAANAQRPVTARLLPAVLLLKAVAHAVRACPEMNGRFVDGEFRPGAGVHLGVAISLRGGGLVAPALHDVDALGLDELMHALADLVKRCRAGSLRSSELSDPTLTVTNLGEQGVASVFGVIYPPQVALVGFGCISEQPWVDDGKVEPMPLLVASLSADHRVSDGHRGAVFLARLRDTLQQPDQL